MDLSTIRTGKAFAAAVWNKPRHDSLDDYVDLADLVPADDQGAER